MVWVEKLHDSIHKKRKKAPRPAGQFNDNIIKNAQVNIQQ